MSGGYTKLLLMRKKENYADWAVGLRRHELMEEMFQRWDGAKPFGEAGGLYAAGRLNSRVSWTNGERLIFGRCKDS